jgi:hypothetical protein
MDYKQPYEYKQAMLPKDALELMNEKHKALEKKKGHKIRKADLWVKAVKGLRV